MKTIKLLHVEDNDGDALIVQEMLRYSKDISAELERATTLKEGLEALSKNDYDIVLLDLGLPDSFEFSAIEKIMEEFPNQSVVVLTGSEGHEKGIKAMGHGADDYLSKNVLTPFSLERALLFTISRKLVSLELRKINRAKDRFFSVLAHDLRGPINSFLSVTDLLQEQGDRFTEEERGELLGSLNDYAHKLSSLLENLLSWSRLQVGTMRFSPDVLDFPQLVHDSLEIVHKLADEKEITIETEISCDQVEADPIMAGSMIRNLLSNAIKFSDRGQSVILRCYEDSGRVCFSIEDKGMGIPRGMVEKVLELGEKVQRAGTEGEPSSGLGLILVDEFAKLHGGSMKISSEEHKGTIVEISLPVSQKDLS